MIKKRILKPERIRRIQGGFGFIEHRFLTEGFLQVLSRPEQLLYFFLVLVSDRHGLSFYSYDSICNLVGLDLSEYLEARDSLIKRDLVCFSDGLFQVLSLPDMPVPLPVSQEDPAQVRQCIIQSLQGAQP